MKLRRLYLFVGFLISCSTYSQDISLLQQFNGHYDFIFIGNTLNTAENNNIDGQDAPPCTILTSASASLGLNPDDTVEKAFLYWAGSGTGDFDVKLNGQDYTAQRTFSIVGSNGFPYFAAFSDVTAQVQATGNGTYTFSDLDLTNVIPDYCPSGGNFGGWAIVIIYKNPALPLYQVNVYDGLQAVPNAITITLDSLNVIDNLGAQIGFVAWEGDKNIAVNESLRINGSVLQNALNPANNAFNGTNSFTNSDQLYNMDLDVYDIGNNISIGDTSAVIKLTSGRDFVMVNSIVTKLNSRLPDATIAIDRVEQNCNSRKILVDYTVYNVNSTNVLPAGVPIAIYADGVFIQYTETLVPIDIGSSQTGQISLLIPGDSDTLDLVFSVDDNGTGHGIVVETDETNNQATSHIDFVTSEPLPALEPLVSCNAGLTSGIFDLSRYEDLLKVNSTYTVIFFASQSDLENGTNPISSIGNYTAETTPATLFVKVENGNCYQTASFELLTKKCPPIVYNYVSSNGDKINDTFFIEGLRNVFTHFELSIYNRWGQQIWSGDNNSPDWDGDSNKGLHAFGSKVPSGTYFYSLNLNDADYPEPLYGFLYFGGN